MNYQEVVSRLELLRDSRDLISLEKTVGELEQELSQVGGEDYSRSMLYVCNLLSSYDFGEYERQPLLLHQYADAALKNVTALPLEVELQLLVHLEHDFEDPGAEDDQERWSRKRRVRAAQWLRALRRLDDETVKDFNFMDLPQVNIAPPDVSLPAGVAPEHVQDPAMRREYEAAIERNQQKADAFAKQWDLRELRNRYWPIGVRYIARAYSRPPLAEAELQRLLNEHLSDEDSKAAILDAARQEIAAGSE